MSDKSSKTPGNTVARVINQRELEDLAIKLPDSWKNGEDSVRELTRRYNLAVLRDALMTAGSFLLDGEVEGLYEELQGNSANVSPQIQTRLEEAGVDFAKLQEDMVSHQTMYRYLRDIRDVERSESPSSLEDAISSVEQSVRKVSGRLRVILLQGIQRLNSKDSFYIDEPDVIVDIRLSCRTCGESKQFHKMLRNSGCKCSYTEQ